MHATIHRTAAQPASEGRIRFITNLLAERQVAPEHVARLTARIAANDINTQVAIATIEWLKGQPRKGAAQPRQDKVTITEAGFYRDAAGAVFMVVESKRNPGRLFAKAVTGHGWDYDVAKGVVYRLTPAMKMTVEQVLAFGVESEICAICSTHLEDPVSKFIGIGPSCGPKYMGKDAYNAAKKVAKADPRVAEQVAAIKAAKVAAVESDRFDDGYWDRQVQLAERAEDERVAAYKMARDRF